MAETRQPSLFIPHGGGPCFFMDDPHGLWAKLRRFLEGLPGALREPPTAILLVSGHWEADGFALTSNAHPSLIYDYYNFPPHTYELRYEAPGSPPLAARAETLLRNAGLKSSLDAERGLDHGVFIPLKVAWPEADVPIVQMSLDQSLDPELHLSAGKALAPLREEGVLIVGSGMSFHNMQAYRDPGALTPSARFDAWLDQAIEAAPPTRDYALAEWSKAPMARYAHPREEHLIPLMVAAGASEQPGTRVFNGKVLDTMISGFRFD
jgi:aromatic ring-opening dioxygenase catalytic subunit (LigB family)